MNNYRTVWICLLVILWTGNAYAQEQRQLTPDNVTYTKHDNLATAYDIIENSYPKYRYFDAGASCIFGGLATQLGITVLNDDEATTSEEIIAYSLLGIGSVRIVDGFYGFLSSRQIEKDSLEFQRLKNSYSKINFGETKLKEGAKSEKQMRYTRSFLIGATSVSSLSLSAIDYDKYEFQMYVGLFLAGVSIYKLLSKSPAEKAWDYYKTTGKIENEKKVQIDYYISPYSKGFIAGISLKY